VAWTSQSPLGTANYSKEYLEKMDANCTLVLTDAAYRRIREYARFAGVSIECAASDAIIEWMNSTGDLVVEAIQTRQKAQAAKPKLTLVSSASHTWARNPSTTAKTLLDGQLP
jgi:hypothetical protein